MATLYASPTGNDANPGTTGSRKTLNGACAAAANGDTVIVGAGSYPTLIINNKSGLIVQAETPPNSGTVATMPAWHPGNSTRSVVIDCAQLHNSPDCIFHDIEFVLKEWIDVTAGGHTATYESSPSDYGFWSTKCNGSSGAPFYAIFSYDATSHAPQLYNCEIHWGHGPNQDPFDPTFKYPEYQSGTYCVGAGSDYNTLGHGDAWQSWWIQDTGGPLSNPTHDGYAYNTIDNSPYAIGGAEGAIPASLLQGCYIHDVSKVGPFSRNDATRKAVLDQFWIERVYRIFIQTGAGSSVGTPAATAGIQVSRGVFADHMGQGFDANNVHGDVWQDFVTINDGSVHHHPNMRGERFCYVHRPEVRGGPQSIFWEGSRGGFPDTIYENPILRDILFLQDGGSALGFQPGYFEDGIVSNVMMVRTPGDSGVAPITIDPQKSPTTNFAGVTLVKNNIAMLMGVESFWDASNNISAGVNYSNIPVSSLMVGPFPPTVDTIENWYAAAQVQAAYTGKGTRYATLHDMVMQPLTTADIDPYVAFSLKSLQSRSVTVTSDKSAIRGPLGDNVTVSVAAIAGSQFQVTDRLGNVVTPWTSTPTAAAVGNYLQVRHTSSSSFQTNVNQGVTLTHATLGAFNFTFTSTTISNIAFPIIHLASTPVSPQYNGQLGADNKKFTLALRFKFSGAGNNYLFADGNTQAGPVVRVINVDASNNKLRLNLETSTGTDVCTLNSDSPALPITSEYLLIYSVDTTTGGQGVTAAVYDLTLGGAPNLFTDPGLINDTLVGFSASGGGAGSHYLNEFVGGPGYDFSFMFLAIGHCLDAADPSNVGRFSAGLIGPNGEGVFGVQPDFFTVGPAGNVGTPNTWNATAGLNRGFNAGKFITAGAAITDTAVAPWPPVLKLQATVLTPGPYFVGSQIQIQVVPLGYAGAFNLTPHTDGSGTFDLNPAAVPAGLGGVVVTYTPTAGGSPNITFTNDGGHTNPASIPLTVAASPWTVIQAGTTVTLTAAQAATLEVVTNDNAPATGVGPTQIRWFEFSSNLGRLQGYDINFDIA